MQRQPNKNAGKDVAVLLCGSRDWSDEYAVREQLERGGARGADRQAEACARELGLAVRSTLRARIGTAVRRVTGATSRCSTGSPTSRTAT